MRSCPDTDIDSKTVGVLQRCQLTRWAYIVVSNNSKAVRVLVLLIARILDK